MKLFFAVEIWLQATIVDGEGVETSGDLAASSPRSAVPPEEETPSWKEGASGVRFRGTSGGGGIKSREEILKELADLQVRDSRRYERERSAVKSDLQGGGLGFRHLVVAMALLSVALVTLLAVFHFSASPPVEAAAPGKLVSAIATNYLFKFPEIFVVFCMSK